MKRKIINIITTLAMIASLLIAFLSTNILDHVRWDWVSMFLTLSAVVMTIIASIVTMLMARSHKITNVYVSSSPSGFDVVNKIARALPAENIVSVTSFSPNDKLDSSVRKAIHKSSVCFLVLSNHISQSQKIEMRELRDQKKKVYVITTPDSVNIPQSFREQVPISSNDEEFEKKLDEIIMSGK